MPRGKIPDRWIPYTACGNVIEGTRIICFKVPLNKNVQEKVPGITKIWDIPAVLEAIPKLGAVIDLTNTYRYYYPSDFQAANVIHRKMLIPGREIPPESKVREFIDAVDEFLGKDGEALVGVHCTHGLNRTGYLVCRYMRDRMNIPADVAIKRFEKARGYQIERKNYIADLLGNTVPPPEFGKGTTIKPTNIQQNCMSAGPDSNERRFSTDRNRQNPGNYYPRNSGNFYGNDRSNSSSSGVLSWRNRGEGSGYNAGSSNRNDGDSWRSHAGSRARAGQSDCNQYTHSVAEPSVSGDALYPAIDNLTISD